MILDRFSPAPDLAPFVSTFLVLETEQETVRTLIPETTIGLGFRYAGSATLLEASRTTPMPVNLVTGLRRSARCMRTSAGGGMIMARFREAAASAFLPGPLHRLFGTTRPMDSLLPPAEVAAASARIAQAAGPRERVAILEAFLRAQRRPHRPDPVVLEALRAIDADPGGIRIGALAHFLGLGQDALEKRFRRAVGASPKAFAAILRLRRAVDGHSEAGNLTRLAHQAGYYDQAHFNHRFRAVVGAPPGQVLGTPDYC